MNALRTPVRAETLLHQVAKQIEDLMNSRDMAGGARIPPETDLVAQMRVSRNTVRGKRSARSCTHGHAGGSCR